MKPNEIENNRNETIKTSRSNINIELSKIIVNHQNIIICLILIIEVSLIIFVLKK